MRRSFIASTGSLLFATIVWAANPSPMNSTAPPTTHGDAIVPQSTEPAATALQVSAPAPMFSYIGADGAWHRAEDLLSRGPVLLVFAAEDEDLRAVQKLAPAFDELGVRPVAVMDLPTRGTSALTRRLGITTTLVSDPMSAIAGLYRTLDPTTGAHSPAYFVIDTRRTVRAMYYGPLPPAELLVATAARGLGRPLPPSVFTTSDER
jgi:peroxiredoxin